MRGLVFLVMTVLGFSADAWAITPRCAPCGEAMPHDNNYHDVVQNVVVRGTTPGTDGTTIRLYRQDTGASVPATLTILTPSGKFPGDFLLVPQDELAPGLYAVDARQEDDVSVLSVFKVAAGTDAMPPSKFAPSSIQIKSSCAERGASFGDFTSVALAITPPSDDMTKGDFMGYDFYLAPAPNTPDILTTEPLRIYSYTFMNGEALTGLSEPTVELSQHPSWKLIVRAVDESGKASEPSEVISFDTTNLPACFPTDGSEGDATTHKGCNSTEDGVGAIWVSMLALVRLWRPRRSRQCCRHGVIVTPNGSFMRELTLYRPVGEAERELIAASNFRKFSPRLSWQPIFYPVLNEAYATQIARDWNTKNAACG